MKLTTFIMITVILQVSATTFAQKITLSEKNSSLVRVFDKISEQSGYDFLVSSEMLRSAKPVSVQVSNLELNEVLKKIFEDQPLDYNVLEKMVVISKKTPTFLEGLAERWAGIDVTGRVVDESGNPLPGATVKVKGKTQTTKTNKDGEFLLKDVDEDAVLRISYVGYADLEIKAKKNIGVVQMQISADDLQEVEINKGYYIEKQRFSVSNVGRITAKDIERQAISNPLQAIIGRIPGVFIEQSNGLVNGGIKVRVQGENSLVKGNDPFYVIDGMPYLSQMPITASNMTYMGSSGGNGSGGGNPLAFINPSDIESIEILKDAEATAIYGSRAANGAILITTKKGKEGKMTADMTYQRGGGRVASGLDLLNTAKYLEMRREAIQNDEGTISPTDYDVNGFWDTIRYANWQKALIGNTAKFEQANVSLSGGNSGTRYLIGGNFQKQGVVFPGSFDDSKTTIHFNLNNSSLNGRLNAQLSGSFMNDINKLPGGDLTLLSTTLAPNAPSLYNADGSLNWAQNPDGASTWTNPLRETLKFYDNKTSNLVANSILSYRFWDQLNLKVNLGYNKLNSKEFLGFPLEQFAPEERSVSRRRARYADSNVESWNIEPQLEYSKNFNIKNQLNALVGTSFYNQQIIGEMVSGDGYISDALLRDMLSATSLTVDGTQSANYKYSAVFGRINYIHNDKYVLNFTGRRDGSSRFGSNNKFQNFGAIGAGWVFSEEKGVQKILPFLNFGKVRFSYGISGNDQIGDYTFMSLYNSISAQIPYQSSSVIRAVGLSNPDIQWEQTKKTQIGLDLGFLKDRISSSITYSKNISSNQLVAMPLPSISGFSYVDMNLPAKVQNSSIEFMLNTVNINNSNLKWRSSFNITIPKNKLLEFPGLKTSPFASLYEIGQPIQITKVYRFYGVDRETGNYLMLDKTGKPTFTPKIAEDRTVVVNQFPEFYGGLQNTIEFKSFQLDFLFQFSKQARMNIYGGNLWPGLIGTNQPVSILGRWEKPGDITSIQKLSAAGNNYPEYNNRQISDAAFDLNSYFARLRNASISYRLPDKNIQKIKLNSLTVFIEGQNLLTFTNYKGLDPETGNSVLPPLRIISAGIKLTL